MTVCRRTGPTWSWVHASLSLKGLTALRCRRTAAAREAPRGKFVAADGIATCFAAAMAVNIPIQIIRMGRKIVYRLLPESLATRFPTARSTKLPVDLLNIISESGCSGPPPRPTAPWCTRAANETSKQFDLVTGVLVHRSLNCYPTQAENWPTNLPTFACLDQCPSTG